MIEFSQTGYVLTLDSTAPVQFSRGMPVQVTLGDDTFTAAADSLALNIVAADGRNNKTPLRVPLTASGTDGVYTGKIGRIDRSGLMLVALSGTVSNAQVITSAAAYVPVYQSVDPDRAADGAVAARGTITGTGVVDSPITIGTGLSDVGTFSIYKKSVTSTGLVMGVYDSSQDAATLHTSCCISYNTYLQNYGNYALDAQISGGNVIFTPASAGSTLSKGATYYWVATGKA